MCVCLYVCLCVSCTRTQHKSAVNSKMVVWPRTSVLSNMHENNMIGYLISGYKGSNHYTRTNYLKCKWHDLFLCKVESKWSRIFLSGTSAQNHAKICLFFLYTKLLWRGSFGNNQFLFFLGNPGWAPHAQSLVLFKNFKII